MACVFSPAAGRRRRRPPDSMGSVIASIHPLARNPGLPYAHSPQVPWRNTERIPIDQNKVGPLALLQRSYRCLHVLGICRVEGIRAENLLQRHGLLRMPAALGPALQILAGHRRIETKK